MPFDLLTRDAPLTVTAEPFTVTAVVATATPVTRRDARGAFHEVLDPAGADLSGLDVPVQDNHARDRALATIGRATNFRREGDVIVADLTFSTARDVENIVARVRDKTLRNVSAGYSVARWRETLDGGTRTRIATEWSIREVSVVALPADPNSKMRGRFMETETMTCDPAAVERTRRSDIRGIARSAGLDPEWADDMIDSEADVTAARAAAFEAMQTRSAPVIRTSAPANDDPAVIASRRADALAVRMAGGDCPDTARQYVGVSMLDTARPCLTASGMSTRGLSPDEVFTRAQHTTSDFPLVVSNAMNKVALDAFRAAESPLKRLARQRSLPNFKPSTSIRLSGAGRLDEMEESGEFTQTSRAERGEAMRLKTYGKAINVSRNLLIDDDMNLLGDMTAAFGQSAAQTEADELAALLDTNPNLSDGTPLFDLSRGNFENQTGQTIGEAGVDFLTDARKAMRNFTDLDGKTLLNVAPRYVVCSPNWETYFEKLLAEIYPAESGNVNPFSGRLELLVEPRIADSKVYVFADPARFGGIAPSRRRRQDLAAKQAVHRRVRECRRAVLVISIPAETRSQSSHHFVHITFATSLNSATASSSCKFWASGMTLRP